MAKLVMKCKFLNAQTAKRIGGYAEYIATRERVEKLDDSILYAPATSKQKKFIKRILKDFPDCKEMLEYDDYKNEETIGNASEFISRALEENLQGEMDAKTYADYIATRPRAERFGSHGLFTDEGKQVQLKKVSRELNQHKGNVWTFIISLRREDAKRLGFDEGKRWREMLRSQTEMLATNLKIPIENLRWYAAFHNESYHPHVHLIAYSVDEQEGYLTKYGVKNLRSSLARDIFEQDLICVYQEQTKFRDELRRVGREEIEEIVNEIYDGNYYNPKVEEMLRDLAERLSKTKAKKVYGYLKPEVKAIVDGIVDELAKDENIQRLYDLWYEQTEEIRRTYTSVMPSRIPLSQNREFKTIRNAVIYEAMMLVQKEKEAVEDSYQLASGIGNILYYMSKVFQEKIKTNEEGLRTIDSQLWLREKDKKEAQGLKQ